MCFLWETGSFSLNFLFHKKHCSILNWVRLFFLKVLFLSFLSSSLSFDSKLKAGSQLAKEKHKVSRPTFINYTNQPLYSSFRNDSIGLKGQCHEIFDFRFFHESVSPKPLSIPIGCVKFFWKFTEIFAAQGASPCCRPTSRKWKKSSVRKVFIILFEHLWVVELTYR